ncbi:MAG: PAS domain S-box protein [Pseudomonadota bacterium]|nr:PAS domain S-box protein [Pseudomonadota bacterium]
MLVTCVVLSLTGFFVFTRESFRFADFFEQVNRTADVQRTLGDLRNAVIRAQDAEQAFVLSGDGTYIDEYSKHAATADEALRRHSGEATLSVAERDAEADLARLIEQSRRQFTSAIFTMSALGMPAALAIDGPPVVAANRARMREMIGVMRDEEAKLLQALTGEAREAGFAHLRLALASGLLALVAVALFSALLRRHHAERDRAEEALRSSEAHFRELFDSSVLGEAECDAATGGFIRVNRRLAAISGFSETELLSRTCFDVVHPEDRGPAMQDFAALLHGGEEPLHFERRYVHKNGSVIWTEVWFRALRAERGRIARVLAAVQDVTPRKKAEQGLVESASLLQAVSDSTEDWVFVKDLKGRIVMANPAVCRAFGLASDQDVLGKTVLEYVPDRAQAEIVFANDMRVMKSGKAETIEQVLTLGGVVRTFISTKSPRLDANRRVVGLVGIATDITERKKNEEALRRTNDRLAELVADRTARLTHLTQYLIRMAEDEKARLAAELHDELGGALSALALDIASALERVKSVDPQAAERLRQAQSVIRETAALKQRIIGNLRPALLDHLGLVPALRDYVAQWSKKSGIGVTVQLAPDCPELSRDTSLALYRVMQESLTNIAKYAHASHVAVELSCRDSDVWFMVEDDGIGIDLESLHRPTSHGITGMQQRMAQIGGELVVERLADGGTRVRARLPYAAGGSVLPTAA